MLCTCDSAVIGNIYASGSGYENETATYDTTKNAFLDGTAKIQVQGGTISGNIYGGGKGVADLDNKYADCARVTEDSKVEIEIAGGTVGGSGPHGGGENAKVGRLHICGGQWGSCCR